MQNHYDVVIIGGGHAGAQAAITLRQLKFAGSIAIVGEEPELPYERPPLSKDYLAGSKAFDRLLLRAETFWSEREIDLLLGRQAIAVNSERHALDLNDGARLTYGKLIWAAGGHPRRLTCAGNDLAGVHYVRTRADVDQLRSELATTQRIAVIGGGYIGLEVSAVLVEAGAQVLLLEAQDRVLARVAAEPLSRFYEAEHRAHDVDIRLGVTVDYLVGDDGRVAGVQLADGELVPADMAVVGIGIVPAVEPLLAAGAHGGNGVDVDRHCATSLPDVYAIGDCACHPNDFAQGAMIRLESVQNANDQGMVVARNITGLVDEYRAMPWFWSNQYDLRLQTVGLSSGHDDIVVRGDVDSRSFSLIYLRDGRIIALDCVNATRDFADGRSLIGTQVPAARERLKDTGTTLKKLLEPNPS